MICCDLVSTTKSSAYLTYAKPEAIRVLVPSFMVTGILFSLLFVRGLIDSIITFYNPLRVKLANVWDIIPPWGVPISVSEKLLLSITPLFNHTLIIVLSSGCINILSSNQLSSMLSKKPLISASKIHLSSLNCLNNLFSTFVFLVFVLILSSSSVFNWTLKSEIAFLQTYLV